MTTHARLGVALTAMNSRRTIARTLESVAGIASKIVVVDSGSTDGTIEICRSHGAVVHHQDWLGYAAQKQFAIDLVDGCEWILLLDSDESLEPDLQKSVERVLVEDDPTFGGYVLNRKLFFLGAWLDHVMQPDRVVRLFRTGRGRTTGGPIHERVLIDGRVGRLRGILRHDSWADMRDLAERSVKYADIAARDAQGSRHGGRPINLVVNPFVALVKELVIKGALLDGRRGFLVACMNCHSTFLKHAFIAASRMRVSHAEPSDSLDPRASGTPSASSR